MWLPGSRELKLDIELQLHTQLQTCANLSELCFIGAHNGEATFYVDKLPRLPGLRSLEIKFNPGLKPKTIRVYWRETAALSMLQSFKCVSEGDMVVQLGTELHHSFTGRLSLASFGQLLMTYTNLQGRPTNLHDWSGESFGLHSGLCNSVASLCALGCNRSSQAHLDEFMRSLAHARRPDCGREWAPKRGRFPMHTGVHAGKSMELGTPDAEGLEWVTAQYRVLCHWYGAPLTHVRSFVVQWDS